MVRVTPPFFRWLLSDHGGVVSPLTRTRARKAIGTVVALTLAVVSFTGGSPVDFTLLLSPYVNKS